MTASTVRKAAVFVSELPTTEAVSVMRLLPARQRERIIGEISSEITGVTEIGAEERVAATLDFAAAGRFAFLSDVAGPQLAALFVDERPQTIAVVAARLPRTQAVGLLAALPPTIEEEVVRRLAVLGPVPRIVLCDLEQAVRTKWGVPAAA